MKDYDQSHLPTLEESNLPTYSESMQQPSSRDCTQIRQSHVTSPVASNQQSSTIETASSNGTAKSQSVWATRDSRPVFARKDPSSVVVHDYNKTTQVRIDARECFDDLVNCYRKHSVLPQWYQVTHVMNFPELSGYAWEHRALLWSEEEYRVASRLKRDQTLFTTIIKASARTETVPLCVPDYFYYKPTTKAAELRLLFADRCSILGIKWNPGPTSSPNERHPDWEVFCRYVEENIPTGRFLFQRDGWTEPEFARTVIEKNEFPVHRDIQVFVNRTGHRVKLPSKWARGTSWSRVDLQIIRQVAQKIWEQWRAEAEDDLRKYDVKY